MALTLCANMLSIVQDSTQLPCLHQQQPLHKKACTISRITFFQNIRYTSIQQREKQYENPREYKAISSQTRMRSGVEGEIEIEILRDSRIKEKTTIKPNLAITK